MNVRYIILVSINLLVVISVREANKGNKGKRVDIFKDFNNKQHPKRVVDIFKDFNNKHHPKRVEKVQKKVIRKDIKLIANKKVPKIQPPRKIEQEKNFNVDKNKIITEKLKENKKNKKEEKFRTIKIIYDLTFLKKTLEDLEESSKLGDIKNLLSKTDLIFKRYVKIKKNENSEKAIEIPENYGNCEQKTISF